jgi:hypothetical protein
VGFGGEDVISKVNKLDGGSRLVGAPRLVSALPRYGNGNGNDACPQDPPKSE